jgi:hypothetical protein
MGLPLALAIASTGLQVLAADSASRAAKAQGALASRQFGNQIKDVKLTATQNHNARLSQFRVFEAVNQSLLGTSGRDEDRSFRAIKERAKKDAFTDIDRLRTQTAMKVGQISLQDSLNKLQVQNKVNAYKFQALGAIIGGATKAYPLMPNTGTMTGTGLGKVGYST